MGVITAIGASVVSLPPLQVKTVLGDGIASALYVNNYWFLLDDTDYFSDELLPSPFLHYWSLGVEEQFLPCVASPDHWYRLGRPP